MSRRTAYALLVFCLLGLGASLGSSYVHYHLLSDPLYASFCDFSTTWSCATVYESRYGAFWGVPVAVPGTIWFVGATLLVLAGWPSGRPAVPAAKPRGKGAAGVESRRDHLAESAPGYLFVWSVIGLSFVLYLAYASFFVLRTLCLLCLVTYVGVIGVFLLAGSASNITMRSLPARLGRDLRLLVSRPAALVLMLLFVVGSLTAVAYFPRQTEASTSETGTPAAAAPEFTLTDGQRTEFEQWYTAQPRIPMPVEADGAAVVVVKFNDYQCPPCGQTHVDYKPILAKWEASHRGAVKYETKHYPLEPECNPNAPGGQHLAACEAAAAVLLAGERGRADELETWLFANQTSLTPAFVRQGAREVGRVTDFESRYPSALAQVKQHVELGAKLGVRGTPTFFINGVRIPGLRAEFFDAAIAYELRQAGVLK